MPWVASSCLAVAILAVLVAGCGTQAPEQPITRRLPADELSYVVDPYTGYPLAADPARRAEIRELYAALREGTDPARVAGRAAEMAGVDDQLRDDELDPPALVLLAQTEYLASGYGLVVERLTPLVERYPDYVASSILRARALERGGQIAEAYGAYRALAGSQSVAAERALLLAEQALDVLHGRFDDALVRTRLDDAEEHLETLLTWAPESTRTLEAKRRLMVARGDSAAELETLRRLVVLDPTPERRLRMGVLEVSDGDVRAGLEILENLDPLDLVEPGDRRTREESIVRARFLRRMQLLPPRVQERAELAELSRADLATLVFWIFPGVRYAPPSEPPIAADILDHGDRREMLKVMAEHVLLTDETVHRFYPERAATRADALGATLVLLLGAEQVPACLGDLVGTEPASVPRTPTWICDRAARCGLVEEPAACLPSATLSGSEALSFFSQGLALLGGEQPAT